VDGSLGSTRALDWAAAEAERCRALLTVVGAWEFGGFAGAVVDTGDAGSAVDAAQERLAQEHPGVGVERKLSDDPAAYALIEAAAEADLLVVGSRGFGGFRGLLLGSVGQHCLTHAACSVAIIRPSEASTTNGPDVVDGRAGRIVVGVDGSDGANLALDWAVGEARRTGGEIDIVASSVLAGASGYVVTVDVGVPDAATQAVGEALARVAREAPEVVVLGATREDPPAVALVDASREAGLLVLGSRGLGAFRGLLLGSVSHHVATHAHCPVVVVRRRPSV
jgi:nucleotide-binding universal stress UspA family protein